MLEQCPYCAADAASNAFGACLQCGGIYMAGTTIPGLLMLSMALVAFAIWGTRNLRFAAKK